MNIKIYYFVLLITFCAINILAQKRPLDLAIIGEPL